MSSFSHRSSSSSAWHDWSPRPAWPGRRRRPRACPRSESAVAESADRLTLLAEPTTVDLGPTTARAWAINGGVPGPTLRRVDVAVRFGRYPGVFLLHCHNLEHEDTGMMLNFEVVG